MLVLHVRKSRMTLAARLTCKIVAETISVMVSVFQWLDPRLPTSVTIDNDTTFAEQNLLRSMCYIKI